ncbi:type II secretion system protein G (GspG) [Acinetobacter marinus]|uniref:Type II secretion system protein G (GspG) n=1 Tax=Acinetobacter marinus TaxID=281375 RepID=A0A1G6H0J1_9GAMM|nr:type II secretion system protein [Acinetobacter marinus]SDB87820.1 type II secretion system protein G (GspG) [Acinetobacter marinus]
MQPFFNMDQLPKGAKQHGFTLIEVMLVIVIMAVMASLIVMNVQGVDQRKVMQARELLVLNLKKIRLESADQGRILGLLIQPATDIAPAKYEVVEYRLQANPDNSIQNQSNQSQFNQSQPYAQRDQYRWQLAADFDSQTLPEQSSLQIQSLDHQLNLDVLKQNDALPQIIWLGNGEALPVRIQLYLQQQQVGDAIVLNRLGAVSDEQDL